MGQQQLLLIILGVIVVGLAVVVGITIFNDSAMSANRDAVTNDLLILASRAQQYYRRPIVLAGGNASFVNLTVAGGMKLLMKTTGSSWTNANGTYTISTAGTGGTTAEVDFQGVGKETGNDGTNKVTVIMKVWADSAKVDQSQTN
jgi:hypothetical protein